MRDFVPTSSFFAKKLANPEAVQKLVSAYAGIPVVAMPLSLLPYWNKQERGEELSESEGEETKLALQDYVRVAGREILTPAFQDAIISDIQRGRGITGTAAALTATLPCRVKADPKVHFGAIRIWGLDMAYIPYTLREREDDFGNLLAFPVCEAEPVTVEKTFLPQAALLLYEPPDSDPRNFWARRIGLPPQDISRSFVCSLHETLDFFHEIRHLRQIDTKLASGNFVARYYAELDSDYAAHDMLPRVRGYEFPAIDETLCINKASRALGLLSQPPRYWFSVALNALEDAEAMPDSRAVFSAVTEIKLRLYLDLLGKDNSKFSSFDLQKAVWQAEGFASGENEFAGHKLLAPEPLKQLCEASGAVLGYLMKQAPTIPLSLLTEIEKQKFITDSFAQGLVNNILSASAFFNPALTQEPLLSVRERISLWLQSDNAEPPPRAQEKVHHTPQTPHVPAQR